jgi:hypothetical protein
MDLYILIGAGVLCFLVLVSIVLASKAESKLLKRMDVQLVSSGPLFDALIALTRQPGAPWSLKRLGVSKPPRLFEFAEPSAALLVVRGRFSSGSIILSRGFILRATESELRLAFQQALLRLKDRRLPRATAGLSGLLGFLYAPSPLRRWVAWFVFERGNTSYESPLPELPFLRWVLALVLTPIVDFFARKSGASPWILKDDLALPVLRSASTARGWIPRLTEGLQPQFLLP